MLTFNKTDTPIIELYNKDKLNHNHKFNKDAEPDKILYLDNNSNKELIINDIEPYIPYPYLDKEHRHSFFINGNAGSFKTTCALNLIYLFLKHIPNIYILYYTGIANDENITQYLKYLCKDEFKYRCLIFTPKSFTDIKKYNEKNKTNITIPYTVEMLQKIQEQKSTHILTIFDDIPNISNNIIRSLLLEFQQNILLEARSHNKIHQHVHLISITHSLNATSKYTQTLIHECEYNIFNLRAQSKRHIINLLLNKYGFDDENIEEILKQKKEGGQITFFSSSWPYLIFNNKSIFIG